MEKDTLQVFLEALLSPVGAGIFLWGFVAFVIKAIKPLDQHEEAKFWLAFITSLVIPPLAFWAQIGLGYATFSWDGLFTSAGVGYMVSQGVHRGTSAVREKIAENEAKAKVEEVNKMASERLGYYTGNIPQGHNPYTKHPEDEWVDVDTPDFPPSTSSYAAPTLPIAPAAPTFTDGERSADTVDLSNSGDVQPYKGM